MIGVCLFVYSLLKELPTDFGSHLQNLTELNLACNQLTTLPESIGAMPKLRCLSLVRRQQGTHLFLALDDAIDLPAVKEPHHEIQRAVS